jgi:hypothetical protein
VERGITGLANKVDHTYKFEETRLIGGKASNPPNDHSHQDRTPRLGEPVNSELLDIVRQEQTANERENEPQRRPRVPLVFHSVLFEG